MRASEARRCESVVTQRDAQRRDLFEIWARGKYFPIFYSRAKIESITESRQTFAPRAASTAAPQQGR